MSSDDRNANIPQETPRRYAGEEIGGQADLGTIASASEVLEGTSQRASPRSGIDCSRTYLPWPKCAVAMSLMRS